MKRSIIFVFALMFLNPVYFYGWGEEGHKITAKIAEAKVKNSVRKKVQKYLGASSFEMASVWMDSIRANKSFDYMKPWHYVNVEKDSVYAKKTEGDVVVELNTVISELKNYKKMSDEEVRKDLKILFHLCGDITQPLHAGYGVDRGGNDVLVTLTGKQLRLHRIWDTDILVSQGVTVEKAMDASKKWSGKEAKAVKTIDPMAWMNDSRQYLPFVYNIENNTISQRYLDESKPIIEAQLAKAGFRLAAVLNEIFKN